MFSFKSVYFVLFTIIFHLCHAEISDKRLCIDEKCSELIAVGRTLQKYISPEEGLLSFAPNAEVKVFSYGAGTRPELVGVEISGKRGYVNKMFIRETQLLKRPKLLVDTELANPNVEVPSISKTLEIKADAAFEPYEVVDGTKIPLDLAASSSVEAANPSESLEDNSESTTPLPLVPVPASADKAIPDVPLSSATQTNSKPEIITDEQLDDQEDEDEDDEEEKEEDSDEEDDDDSIEMPNSKPEPALSNKEVKLEAAKELDNVLNNVTNLITNTIEVKAKEDSVQKSNEAAGQDPNENKEEIIDNFKGDDTYINTTDTEHVLEGSLTSSKEANSVHIDDAFSSSEEKTEEPNNLLVKSDPITQDDAATNLDSNEATPPALDLNVHVVPTTEMPLEIEAPMPDLDIVTEDPSAVLSREQSAENPGSSQESSNEEKYVDADVVQEEPSGSGILGGLTNMLPLFGSAVAKEERMPNVEEAIDGSSENTDTIHATEINITEQLNDSKTDNETYENIDTKNEFIEKVEELVTDFHTSKDDPVKLESSEIQNDETTVTPEVITEEKPLIEDNAPASEGLLAGIQSFFGFGSDNKNDEGSRGEVQPPQAVDDIVPKPSENSESHIFPSPDVVINTPDNQVCDSKTDKCPQIAKAGFCDKDSENCEAFSNAVIHNGKLTRSFSTENLEDLFIEAFSSDLFLYLTTTSLSVLVLIFVWIFVEKCRRETPLIARINKLEQQLLATIKENEVLQDNNALFVEEKTQLVVETVPNEIVEELNYKLSVITEEKLALEEQIQALEKELDNSTEVGIELNKIMSEMLSSGDGSEILKENLEQMQKKLLEQQGTINGLNASLSLKETENHELRLELEITRKKVADLQGEVNSMVDKILKIEDEKDRQQRTLESEVDIYQNKCKDALAQEHVLKNEIRVLSQKVADLQRLADIKVKEYNSLKETLTTIKSVKNDKDALKSFLNVSEIKAQLEQMKTENIKYSEQLSQEREANISYVSQLQTLSKEINDLREKYAKADKDKVEINTKLEVLNNYFKEREVQMQKEISKYESLWAVKEGETTSTTERVRYMQDELQNCKQQNENLKQEIFNQEVELKSQISMLEKKNQENWVTNRQTERKLEEARQEAALLRNRLTLRERAIADSNNQIRVQSPLHQNGELPISPPPLNPTQSPPPMYNSRDHMTKSPPIPGLPPLPFLPPPLGGAPFMPPPPLDGIMPSPFMHGLPPGMFPGDHRPPPLGRMSSPPPVGGRYSPESTVYSEYDRYDRRSPSPPYDSEYGASPPPIRGYSPYNDRGRTRDDRREYKRPQPRSNGRNSKGLHSSGSENDSLGKASKKPQRKV